MNRNVGVRQNGSGASRRPRGRHGSGGESRPQQGQARPDNRPRSASMLRNQSFDSNGPDVRVRGNAWQVYEKYQSLARDATSAGDRVMAENYLQHAEHYYRITEAIEEAALAEQRQRSGSPAASSFDASPQQVQPQQSQVQPQQQPEVPSNYYAPDGQLVAGQQSVSTRGQDREEKRKLDSVDKIASCETSRGTQRKPISSPSSPFFGEDEVADERDLEPQTFAAKS